MSLILDEAVKKTAYIEIRKMFRNGSRRKDIYEDINKRYPGLGHMRIYNTMNFERQKIRREVMVKKMEEKIKESQETGKPIESRRSTKSWLISLMYGYGMTPQTITTAIKTIDQSFDSQDVWSALHYEMQKERKEQMVEEMDKKIEQMEAPSDANCLIRGQGNESRN